jgi:ABC-2 type transport system permease protein
MSALLQTAAAPDEAATAIRRTWPFYWSVRRELWENRFLFIAPLSVAALVLISYIFGTVRLPGLLIAHGGINASGASAPPQGLPYSIAAIAVMVTGIIVAIFYCLGALYNEKRDRSILFWKSLPVSDRVAVLSKAAIPLVVLPAIIFVIVIAMQLVMLVLTFAIVVLNNENIPAFWTHWPFFQMVVVVLYGLVTLALWHAPLYAWMLLVSAWAKRVPFLWAVLTPAGLCLVEKIALGTSFVSHALANRLAGAFPAAFTSVDAGQVMPVTLAQLAPLQFLGTPALWSGLAITVVFLAAAIRLRRYRGPL